MEIGVDLLLHGNVVSRDHCYCENALYTSSNDLLHDGIYFGRLLYSIDIDQGIEKCAYSEIGMSWFHVYTNRKEKNKYDGKKTTVTVVDKDIVSNLPRQHQNIIYKIILQCDTMSYIYKYPISTLLILYPTTTAADDVITIRPCDTQRLLQNQLAKSGDRVNLHNISFDIKVYPCNNSYSIIASNTQVCILPKQENQIKSYIAVSHGASLLNVHDDLYVYSYMLKIYQSATIQQLSNYMSVFVENPSSPALSLLLLSSDIFHKDISAIVYSMIQLHRGKCDIHYLTITPEALMSNGKNGKYLEYFYRNIQLVYLLLSHQHKVVLVLPEADHIWDSFPGIATAIIDLITNNKLSNLFIIGISTRINNEMKGIFIDILFMSLPSHAERKHIANVVINEIEKKSSVNVTVIDREELVDRLLDTIPRCVVPTFIHAIVSKYTRESINFSSNVAEVVVGDSFSDVIGLRDIKQTLTESIVWPTKYGNIYRDLNMSVDVGVMLYGPPGTGKTKLPKVVAATLRYPLLVCKLSEILSGEVGSSEKKLSAIFQEAKGCSPCIIFIDEMQALFTNRADNDEKQSIGHSLSSTLAVCLDDIYMWNNNASTITSNSQITIIASTNEPWAIDTSFLRPGRFDKLLFVGPLSEVDRQLFITQRMNQLMKNNECIIVSQEILQLTNGFTGADMTLLMQKLLIQVHSKVNNLLLQDEINNILIKILKEGQIKRSVTEKELLTYNRWQSSACIY